jgi:uncharacterized protein (TIGR02271 family)
MSTFGPDQLVGSTAIDANGDKIGKIGQVYLDDQSEQPTWVTVKTGLFGARQSFAPLAGASMAGEELQLGVSKDQVKGAPNIDDDGHVGPDEQRALYDHYAGVLGDGGYAQQTAPVQQARGRTGSRGRSGSAEAMTRSEEQLRVGTENVETGRARLRKYVVTENVTRTVPVSHEEVRVEREPITEDNMPDATSGPDISEAEQEVTLHAERPTVHKETVPVERVRMDTETVAGQAQVDDTVRKERVEVEGDDAGRRGRH